jgi:hypothetical protein
VKKIIENYGILYLEGYVVSQVVKSEKGDLESEKDEDYWIMFWGFFSKFYDKDPCGDSLKASEAMNLFTKEKMCPCYSKTWIWSLDPYLIIITL